MSDIEKEETVEQVAEPAQTDAPVKSRKPRTKKVAEESSDVIVESSIEEAKSESVNEDGQKIITGPAQKKAPKSSNVHSKDNGVIGSHAADRSLNKKTENKEEPVKKKEEDKVALWSKGNIRWTGVGALSKGYNIVTKEAAEKWLTREGIREASPEEVATYYGK